jgi:hypothetical protein
MLKKPHRESIISKSFQSVFKYPTALWQSHQHCEGNHVSS